MCDSMFKILVDLNEEIKNKLKDPYINDYTQYQYKRYEMLLTYLLDEYSL